MKLWNFLFGTNNQTSSIPSVNPSTGLPMIDHSPMDVGGNTFGTESGNWSSSNIFDNSFSNSDWSTWND